MGGAEGVVDEDVAQPGQLGGEGRVVGLLLGVKAHVLEQHHVARLERVRPRPRAGRPTQSVAKPHGAPSSSPRRSATGWSEYFGSRLPSGRPEVRQQHDPRAAFAQVLERRQRGADAGVVGDARRRCHGHVEVDADQGGLAAPVHVADGAEAAHPL